MLHKTRGIVISHLKFRETSIIVKVFTEEFGLQSYIVNGVRSSRSQGKIALYQPMSILDMVVYRNEQKSVQRISESKFEYHYADMPFNMKKSAVAMFWSELLARSISDENLEDKAKFNFIREQLITLDKAVGGIEHFPVKFGLYLCKYLGFEILSPDQLMISGSLEQGINRYYEDLIAGNSCSSYSKEVRKDALKKLLEYYQSHFEGFNQLKTVKILKQLFE